MCAEPTQKNRSISIKTPLGEDKLLLTRFTYSDALNALFTMTADLLSTDQSIAFDQIVGHPVTISMDLAGGSKRYFHGIVASFVQAGRAVGSAVYHASIVPWLAHLANVSDCQIFQNESIPDIVSKVIKKAGFTDIQVDLTGSYSPLEFCVQYRETNLHFVSRLLEKAGICYYFKHEESRHVLVLTDQVSKHAPYSGYETIPYREAETTGSLLEVIKGWTLSMQARTVRFAQTDFDFKRPKVDLKVVSPVSRSHGLADFEQFDYPGEYVAAADGEQYAKARIEAIQSQHEIVTGQASCRGLATGCTFKLSDHPRADQNREYLLTDLALHFDADGFSSGGGGGVQATNGEAFGCSFSAMPTTQQYRPERTILKTLIVGPQTAIVTGPAGEEIHTDEHGRVKVHFHWDRYGKYDDASSCWVRVSQLWAGKGWGGMHIPRIGQEVIVEFLEGDPDRPIITGRVYNGDETPPYALPANKNISTIKSESTKGGNGFNEVKMDDTKGSELLHIRAEKDRTVLVKNDNSETVSHDESIDIGNDLKTKIGKNCTTTVGENQTVEIGKKLSVKAGEEISFVCGSASITMKKDGKIEITGVDITVKSGGGKLNIDTGGIITVKGPMVKIN
jgi:type VI secretion system secreted protein VgrG